MVAFKSRMSAPGIIGKVIEPTLHNKTERSELAVRNTPTLYSLSNPVFLVVKFETNSYVIRKYYMMRFGEFDSLVTD